MAKNETTGKPESTGRIFVPPTMAADERMSKTPARSLSLLPVNVVENILRRALDCGRDDDGDCTAALLAESCQHFYRTWRSMILHPGPHAAAIAAWLANGPDPMETLLTCGSSDVDGLLRQMLELSVSGRDIAG